MRRPLIALAAGFAITVPAAVGLLGNASFAQRPPLTSPTSASTTTHPTPSATDDSSTPTPSASSTVDDHGGNRPAGVSDDPPGDDHGGNRPAGDDNSSPRSDSSGHGSDDSSNDDSGRHGSDD